jgi:hypothetical protein
MFGQSIFNFPIAVKKKLGGRTSNAPEYRRLSIQGNTIEQYGEERTQASGQHEKMPDRMGILQTLPQVENPCGRYPLSG